MTPTSKDIDSLGEIMVKHGIEELELMGVIRLKRTCPAPVPGAIMYTDLLPLSPTDSLHAGTDVDESDAFPHASPLTSEQLEAELQNLGNDFA